MVLSCLVEPLVSPLVGRGTTGRRRSGLSGTRLASTALACTALLALANPARAETILADANEVRIDRTVRNAHVKPKTMSYLELVQTVFTVQRREELAAPPESACFEQDAVEAHRLKHKRDIVRDSGPSLGLGQRIDRLFGASTKTYLRFGSGVHQSAIV